MYFHGGSGNRGCEAIVKTLLDILPNEETYLYSYMAIEDIDLNVNIIKQSYLDTNELEKEYKENSIALSIGGDNYCFPNALPLLEKYNQEFKKRNVKTAIIGCSIEENLIKLSSDQLKTYDLITARETITYNNLKKYGIKSYVIPDSAFILDAEYLPFIDNVIGINASNIVKNEKTIKNYETLIDYILQNTNYNIALIPHVIQPHNDDLQFLKELKGKFNDPRVILIEKGNCNQIKGYIARCKMLICARTHASIAGYSSCVPTLVLGYSVKSKGIATDLFRDYKNYVLPFDNLKTDHDLKDAFLWLSNNYNGIKKHLEGIMPKYKERCYELHDLLRSKE